MRSVLWRSARIMTVLSPGAARWLRAPPTTLHDDPSSVARSSSTAPVEEDDTWFATECPPTAAEHHEVISELTSDDATIPKTAPVPSEFWSASVKVLDKNFAEIPTSVAVTPLASLQELHASLPPPLREQFAEHRISRGITQLTLLQKTAIPLLRAGQSACLIGPTGTGKTLTYMVPLLARILDEKDVDALGSSKRDTDEQRTLEDIASEFDADAPNICRFCGLSVCDVRVCPETGAIHARPIALEEMPPTPDEEGKTDVAHSQQGPRPKVLREVHRECMPALIVVTPKAVLTRQIHAITRSIHSNLKIREYFRMADDPKTTAKLLADIGDADVLIAPLLSLHMLILNRKIKFHRLQSIVFEEVESCFAEVSYESTETIIKLAVAARKKQQEIYGAYKASAASGSILPNTVTKAAAHPVQFIFVGALLPRQLRICLVQLFRKMPGQVKFLVAAVGDGSNDCVQSPVRHTVLLVSELDRANKLTELYKHGLLRPEQRTLVFVNGRSSVHWLAGELAARLQGFNINITKATGSTNVEQTEKILQWFARGTSTLLIATDVLSSGIDFKNVENVVVFEMPQHFEDWVHRVGRCGRMGQVGHAITLFTPEDVRHAKKLVKALRERSQRVPPRLAHYAANNASDVILASLHKHKLKPGDPERHNRATGSIYPRYINPRQIGRFATSRRPVS